MTIKVTKKDIRNGVLFKDACPIALALMRSGASKVSVCAKSIEFFKKGASFDIPTPHEAKAFIIRFDAGFTVKPFSFTIETPK